MVRLRSFDAFPKTHELYESHDRQSSPVPYLFLAMVLFMLYMETSTWMGARTKYDYSVEKGIQDSFQINIDITLTDRCSMYSVFIQDESDDSLFVNELVHAETIQPDPWSDEEWCRVRGEFDTNRVHGRLSILTSPQGVRSRQMPFSSYFINELSFGEYYPSMINPLDFTHKKFEEPSVMLYYLSIVPTTYRAFGISLDTNQYTVTEVEKTVKNAGVPPGVHFEYDFEPIHLTLSDNRISFFAWLCRVVNIMGGVLCSVQVFRRFFPAKGAGGDARNRSGLLDQPTKH